MSMRIIPYNPIPLLLGMNIPLRLKLVCVYEVLRSACYKGTIFPYNGVTIKLNGCRPIIVVDCNAESTVWVHELIHVYGGNELSSEIIDAVTDGSEPTDAELSTAGMTLVRRIRDNLRG